MNGFIDAHFIRYTPSRELEYADIPDCRINGERAVHGSFLLSGPNSDLSDISKVFEADDIFTFWERMSALVGSD